MYRVEIHHFEKGVSEKKYNSMNELYDDLDKIIHLYLNHAIFFIFKENFLIDLRTK